MWAHLSLIGIYVGCKVLLVVYHKQLNKKLLRYVSKVGLPSLDISQFILADLFRNPFLSSIKLEGQQQRRFTGAARLSTKPLNRQH